MRPPHILIAGAGIGGLTAALALAQNGAKVDIIEQAPELGEIGAGIQQAANAMQVHKALGVDKEIEAVAFEPDSIEFRDFKTGKSLLSHSLEVHHNQRYGHKYLHIHRADLHKILYQTAMKAGVGIHLGQHVEDYKQDNESVYLTSRKQSFEGDILIGADGINSAIRRQMLGPENNHYSGNVAWRGIVPAHKLPKDLLPGCTNNWLGPRRHFISYYLRGGDLINFVAVEERDDWAEESWSQKGDIDELRSSFAGWDEPVTEIIKASTECYLWGLFDHPSLSGWTEGRVALLGDAAHPMLPFLAQGASMAIEDGWVLAQSIYQHLQNPAEGLRAYERARYTRATLIQKMSRDNAKLYHTGSRIRKFIRDAKFKIGTHIPLAAHSQLDKIFNVNVVKEFPAP